MLHSMLYLFLYLLIAIPFAYAPYRIANYFGKRFGRKIFSNSAQKTYQDVQLHVRRRRIYVSLLLFCFAIVVLCAAFYAVMFVSFVQHTWNTGFYFAFVGILTTLAFLLYRLTNAPKVKLAEEDTKDYYTIKNIVETLSITAGIKPPQVSLWANSTPGLSLFIPVIGQPVLYVTTSLVSNFSRSEIEACVAHEIGKFITKRVRMQKILNALTVSLEVSGLILSISLLSIINPFLPFVWFALQIMAAIVMYEYVYIFTENFNLLRTTFLISNPVYLCIVLITQFAYYISSYGETLYADLKAIELTRYPQGLYSALTKMDVDLGRGEPLPSLNARLIFVGELVSVSDSFFTQSLTEDRKELLKSFDPTLTNKYEPIEPLFCGVCNHELGMIVVNSFHQVKIPVGACKYCGFLWFDDGALYTLSSADNGEIFKEYTVLNTNQQYKNSTHSCPRCGVVLQTYLDGSISKDVDIYNCKSCKGDLISAIDFIKYVEFREGK